MKLYAIQASLLLTLILGTLAKAESAKDIYEDRCAKCHGTDGDGNGRGGRSLKTKSTAFNDKVVMAKATDEILFKSIKEGGPAVGQSKEMEAFSTLTDPEVKDLITYIRAMAK